MGSFLDAASAFAGVGEVDTSTDSSFAWRECTRITTEETEGWLTGFGDDPPAPATPPPPPPPPDPAPEVVAVETPPPLPPPVPATDLLVAQAESQLDLDLPEVATSPPRGGTQLVGVPVWFWIENYQPASTTAEVPGLAATLTATPATTHIAISTASTTRDGAPIEAVEIDCEGPGTPWDRNRHDEWEASECSYPFDWNATYTIEATVEWDVAWSATNGEAGDLAPLSRTRSFTLTVEEAQAVTD
ncbi:hypothetical protein BH23ACT2_BH23ACT2_09190 [soil metagenome]